MAKFQEKVLFEYWNFIDKPWVSASIDFKFSDGVVADSDMLRGLLKNVELIEGDGQVIKPDIAPIWHSDRPFRLTYEFDSGLGVMLPRNAVVRGMVAQDVPDLIGMERSSISL
jgi:hypothetical protein